MRVSLADRLDLPDPVDEAIAGQLGNGCCHLCDGLARHLAWIRGSLYDGKFVPVRVCDPCAADPGLGPAYDLIRALPEVVP